MTRFQSLYWIGAAEQVKAKNPNHEIEQKMRLVLNDKPALEKTPELSPEDKKEVSGKFRDLYFGLTWLNWMQDGATLGQAWHGALEQIDAIVQSKSQQYPDNRAAKYLVQIAKEHKKRWSQIIMVSENAGKKMEIPPGEEADYRRTGEKAGRGGLEGLNAKLRALEPKVRQKEQHQEMTKVIPMFPEKQPRKDNIIDMALWNRWQRQAG